MAARAETELKARSSDYDYSSFYYSSSDDIFAILEPYTEWYDDAQLRGYYLLRAADVVAADDPHRSSTRSSSSSGSTCSTCPPTTTSACRTDPR